MVIIATAMDLAAQSQAAFSINYTQTGDSGSFPSSGVTATGTINVDGSGNAINGTLDVSGAVPSGLSGSYTLVAGNGVNSSSQFSYDSLVNTASPGGQFLTSSGGLLFVDAAGDQMNLWYNTAAVNYSFATPPNVIQPAGSYSLWGWQTGAGQNNDYTQTFGIATLSSAAVPEPGTYGALAGAGLFLVSLRNKFGRKQA